MGWVWSQDSVIMSAMVFALLFAGVGLLVNTGRSCDTTNNFLVLNDANLSNQSLSQLYFDCLKYCGDKFSQSLSSKTECFAQCNNIGDFQSPAPVIVSADESDVLCRSDGIVVTGDSRIFSGCTIVTGDDSLDLRLNRGNSEPYDSTVPLVISDYGSDCCYPVECYRSLDEFLNSSCNRNCEYPVMCYSKAYQDWS